MFKGEKRILPKAGMLVIRTGKHHSAMLFPKKNDWPLSQKIWEVRSIDQSGAPRIRYVYGYAEVTVPKSDFTTKYFRVVKERWFGLYW